MRTHLRSGEANVPAIILSTAVLIFALAVSYYLIAIIPTLNDDDVSSSSSSSVATITTSSASNTDGAMSTDAMTAEEKAAYDGCINAATEAHNQRWSAACAEKKNAQQSAYLACVQKGQTESYCSAQFPYQDIDANCDLGVARTTALNLQYAAAKQACAK